MWKGYPSLPLAHHCLTQGHRAGSLLQADFAKDLQSDRDAKAQAAQGPSLGLGQSLESRMRKPCIYAGPTSFLRENSWRPSLSTGHQKEMLPLRTAVRSTLSNCCTWRRSTDKAQHSTAPCCLRPAPGDVADAAPRQIKLLLQLALWYFWHCSRALHAFSEFLCESS